jgi:hypothetical protein
MIYLLCLFIIGSGYYTTTYGVHLWKNENNKLGGVGTIIIAVVGTIVPIIVLFVKQ